MRQMFREIGRAPARILTSVFALALAVGAIGVFAIPSVASSSLRASVDDDQMAHLALAVTDSGNVDLDGELADLANVAASEGRVVVDVGVDSGPRGAITLPVVGFDPSEQRVDIVSVDVGRLPSARGEVVVADGVASLGESLTAVAPDGHIAVLNVVGIGGTSYWSGTQLAFSDLATARDLAGIDGFNRIGIRALDDSSGTLRATTDELRTRLAAEGVTFTAMPASVADGTHPIEAEISQVSTIIGFLGIVAGLVALVLLGSTVTTLITERTGEVAVMRALGGRERELRRRLRRLSVGIAIAAVVLGVPLGIAISNVIARLVLQEFVGITPAIGVSWPVVAASAVFAIVGARIVAGGAARRVTRLPLAAALRDRDGQPFGRRRAERLIARLRLGGLLDRSAVRNLFHRRSRSAAIFAQIGAAVAALLITASLATTINAFNDAEYEPWTWNSRTTVAGDGLDIDAALVRAGPRSSDMSEPAIESVGEVDGWEVDLAGLESTTSMIDRTVDAGQWLTGSPGEVVVSTGFADYLGVAVGDDLTVELSTGSVTSRVVGLHRLRGRTLFFDVDELAAELGQPGRVNVVYSTVESPVFDVGGLTSITTMGDWTADDSGRQALLLIFSAIGAIVVAVAGLAVASGVAVNVFERRHELAAIRAIGGRWRDVMRVVSAELLPLAVAGIALGVVAGWFGSRAIVTSFENADAVQIGLVFAAGAIPAAAAIVLFGCVLISGSMVRRIDRRSLAETLRTAA